MSQYFAHILYLDSPLVIITNDIIHPVRSSSRPLALGNEFKSKGDNYLPLVWLEFEPERFKNDL